MGDAWHGANPPLKKLLIVKKTLNLGLQKKAALSYEKALLPAIPSIPAGRSGQAFRAKPDTFNDPGYFRPHDQP
jgi:hypothetical protein